MKKLKILHIIDSFNLGGTEKQCVEIVQRINPSKFQVHVVTFNTSGPLAGDLLHAGIPFKEFPISRSFYTPQSLFSILNLAGYMRSKKFDIINTYGFYSTIPGVIAGKMANIPLILTGKRELNYLQSNFQITVEKNLMKLSDRIIVNAKCIRDYLVKHYHLDYNKILIISNGVAFPKFPTPSSVKNTAGHVSIGMVARFRRGKDHITFLQAAKEILRVKKNVRFVLVGSGPGILHIKRYVCQLGIQDNVSFYGEKNTEELHDILSGLDVSVLCSMSEGLPNVILESMALGVPVVANECGGVPEIIKNDFTGILVPCKRPDILAEKIIYLIDNIDIAKKISINGLKLLRSKYNFDSVCQQYESLYERLSKEKNI